MIIAGYLAFAAVLAASAARPGVSVAAAVVPAAAVIMAGTAVLARRPDGSTVIRRVVHPGTREGRAGRRARPVLSVALCAVIAATAASAPHLILMGLRDGYGQCRDRAGTPQLAAAGLPAAERAAAGTAPGRRIPAGYLLRLILGHGNYMIGQ